MKDGMILNQPTIFGYNPMTGDFMGGGEAGSEAVVGVESLNDMIRRTVSDILSAKLDAIGDLLAQAPVWVDGKYMWSRVVTYYSDNTSVISNTTCIAGATGATGAAGTNGTNGTNGKDGKDGKDGTSVTILGSYDTLADLTREHPTGTAGDSYIVDGDLYVWSTNTSAWVNVGQIQGEPGADGQPGANGEPGEDSVGVSSIDAQYYLSTSKTDREGGQWLDTCPPWESGKYLWTRSKITYSDSTTSNPPY